MCDSEHLTLTHSTHSQSVMNVLYGPNEIVAQWSIDPATDEIQKQPGDDPMKLININRKLLTRESTKREEARQKRISDKKDTVLLEKIISEYPQMHIKKLSHAPPKVTAKKLKMYGSPNQDQHISIASTQWSYINVFTWVCLPLLGILIACVTIRTLCRKWYAPGPVQGLDVRAVSDRPLNACSLQPPPSRSPSRSPSTGSGAATPLSTPTDSTVVSEFILDS